MKSRAILPQLVVDDEPDAENAGDIAEKLQAYRKFKILAKGLRELESRHRQAYSRELLFQEKIHFFPDATLNSTKLRRGGLNILERLQILDKIPKVKIKEVISISERITQLQNRLMNSAHMSLNELLADAHSKEEVILTFLAMLELVKQRWFSLEQNELFGDMLFSRKETSIERAAV